MNILDGQTTSKKILASLQEEVSQLNFIPNLDIILVGDDPASIKYVELKNKKASEIGIGGQIHRLDKNSNTDEVVNLINQLNQDSNITGLMVQLPLPSQIDTAKVLLAINPAKDADGLSPVNLGLLFQKGQQGIASATALGIIKLIEEYNIDLSGKNAVIIGRSSEVSLPLFALLMDKNCTITICHSYTQNLSEICQKADILISAIGKPHFLGKEFVKPNAIIIDVGFATDTVTGKTTGDFNFEEVSEIAGFITPVPGGVGPMTVASLLFNTVQIAKNRDIK
jgi:methylenetetrahydrofolate dehydrogenase (NADP+)/methenyltetrahydrofolate cyclohydrolase